MGLYENTQEGLKLIAGSTLYADMAVGSIIPFGGSVIPPMFLLCDGSAVSRTDYADLFTVIGTSFGAGDGSTTFNLPDLRESVPKGAGLTGKTVGAHLDADGLAVGEFLDDRVQDHSHRIPTAPNGSPSASNYVMEAQTPASSATILSQNVVAQGRSGATTEVKSVGVNYIIKAKQISVPADFIDATEDYIDEKVDPIESDVTGLIDNANKNGCVNILPNEAVTQVDNGITYTVRDDGTVIANGTATATSSLAIKIKPNLQGFLPAKLSGCPAGGGLSTYRVQYANYSTVDNLVLDFGDGGIIETQFDYETYPYARAMIRIESGQTVNNLEFRPMITLASQPNSDYNHYVPYSMTNSELTSEIGDIASELSNFAKYTFGNAINVTSNMSSGYTVASDGYIEASAQSTVGSYIKFSVNGIIHTAVGGTGFYPSTLLFVKKGMILKHSASDYSNYAYIFHPLV